MSQSTTVTPSPPQPISSLSLENRLIAAKIYLNTTSPFFSTLVNNTPVMITESGENDIGIAATDGRQIYFSREYCDQLSDMELTGVLCHEVLHMAFSHVYRFKSLPRPEGKSEQYFHYLANYAADIIVNGVINKTDDLRLPEGAVTDSSLELLSFPEVYSRILQNPPPVREITICFGGNTPQDGEALDDGDAEELQEKYSELLERAKMAEDMAGNATSRLSQHINAVYFNETLNYREMLSQFIISSRDQWGGYDRRFVHEDRYLDDAISDELNIVLFIDTSGSVDENKLAKFIQTVEDNLALSSWAKINRMCYYFDTEMYGPYDSFDLSNIEGFGGTNFYQVADKIRQIQDGTSECTFCMSSSVFLIYTDGLAKIPSTKDLDPSRVIWILNEDFKNASWSSSSVGGMKNIMNMGWDNVVMMDDD